MSDVVHEIVIPVRFNESESRRSINVMDEIGEGTRDYKKLYHRPKLNGLTLDDDHDAAYYGLVPAVAGKGLSSNDFTDADKAVVTRLNDPTKGLSTNDYTNEDKQKLNQISAKSGTIDSTKNALIALLGALKSRRTITQAVYDQIIATLS